MIEPTPGHGGDAPSAASRSTTRARPRSGSSSARCPRRGRARAVGSGASSPIPDRPPRIPIMFSILGLPDEGRDALMSAALDPPDPALESWRRWERSGADARTDPVARRWLPLIGHNLRDAPVDPPVRALFVEARRHAWASNLALLDAARPALESLAAAGIRTMLLKGAVLAIRLTASRDSVPLATSTCSSSLSTLAGRRASSRSRAGSRGAGTASAIFFSLTVSICRSRRTARSTCTGICWRSAAGKAPTRDCGSARSR